MISEELLARLRVRAADDRRRTDAVPATGTGLGDGAFQTVVAGLDGSRPEPPGVLPPPASPTTIAATEARLGFPLPGDLAQLYSSVAEGGFGPSAGLASLEAIADRYGQLMAAPQGEDGQEWPQHLLPIGLATPGADCYDLRSGHIVCWDEESLAAGPGDQILGELFQGAVGEPLIMARVLADPPGCCRPGGSGCQRSGAHTPAPNDSPPPSHDGRGT